VELRQYTLKPGRRDTLINLFEKEFIESQEEVGMQIIGTFRDLENSDRFVWLRGFQEMHSRATQLQRFYGGPIWKAHRDAANATMLDSDNVLLLRPVMGPGFSLPAVRPPSGAVSESRELIVATIYHLENGAEVEFVEIFESTIAPILAKTPTLGTFITEHAANTFPALPVREDANVFVCFWRVADRASYAAQAAQVADQIAAEFAGCIKGSPEVLFLAPTDRSLL
jgi:hypothetical protein